MARERRPRALSLSVSKAENFKGDPEIRVKDSFKFLYSRKEREEIISERAQRYEDFDYTNYRDGNEDSCPAIVRENVKCASSRLAKCSYMFVAIKTNRIVERPRGRHTARLRLTRRRISAGSSRYAPDGLMLVSRKREQWSRALRKLVSSTLEREYIYIYILAI